MARANTANTVIENTSASIQQQMLEDVEKAKQRKTELHDYYLKENKVRVTGSPFYRPYFGNVMPLIINGIGVYVPMDGKSYEIPKTFADLFQKRIARIDSLIQKQGAMAGIVEENYAGEVDLITEV